MFSTVLCHASYWDNVKQTRFQCHALLLLLKRGINDWLKIKGRQQKLGGKGPPQPINRIMVLWLKESEPCFL